METLQLLGTALGLTAMAGINLYLTVFVTGLAIRMNWLQLASGLEGLEVLAQPPILIVAGVLLAIEFIVDKTPYFDSAWDSIHTVIRPIGAAFLALTALGQIDPVMEIVAVLLGGTVALSSHAVKAGTRLMINMSPEPVSNIAASVGEDAIVLGGIYLAFAHPIIAICLVALFMIAFWYCAPKFFRFTRANMSGLVDYFRAKRRRGAITSLSNGMPAFACETWLVRNGRADVAWAVPCFSGRLNPIGRNVRGCLVATMDRHLYFIGKKNFRTRMVELPLTNVRLMDEPGRIFHRILISGSNGDTCRLRFTRRYAGLVPQMMDWMRGPVPVTEARFELVTTA